MHVEQGVVSGPAGLRQWAQTCLRRRWLRPFLLLSPVTCILLVFFVVPALVFLLYSFWGGRAFRVERVFTLRNYAYALTNVVYLRVALHTLWTGLLTASVTTLLSYPLAYFLTFRVRRGRNLVLFLVVITLLSGYLVRVYAWRTILGRTGLINSFLLHTGLLEEPLLFLVFSRFAVVITLVSIFLPFTILPILSSLANIRRELIEAAKDLGAGPLRAFLRVTLPMSMTGVISGFTYTLVLSAGDYITPELVGGTTGMMIGRSIAEQFIRTGNWPLGSAISFLILSLFMVLYFGIRWAVRYLKLAPAG
jgi:spermidine/putrescine transport system permease protein